MSTHILCAEPYVFAARVYEAKGEYVVDLLCLNSAQLPTLSESFMVYRDAWFNALIQPLRKKNIHLFDRQHVMASS